VDERLRAVCDLDLVRVREGAGRHEYDGRVPDLSPDGVRRGLARLGAGAAPADPHDAAHLAAAERRLHAELGDPGDGGAALHRRSPRRLLAALDLAVYDRPYAPAAERADARRRHLAAWPDAVDAGLAALDLLTAPVAGALVGSVRGAAATVDPDEPGGAAALAAHDRLVAHLERAADTGDPDPALGGAVLARLLADGGPEPVDLDAMAAAADAERDRLLALLGQGCSRLRPGAPAHQVVEGLVTDHPDADGVLTTARALTAEVVAFTREHDLLDPADLDGECRVEPSPPSRRWATAMLAWAAPGEPDGPSYYSITPPDPSWPEPQQRQWLSAFSHTTLPTTTAHEVAPGHFAHGRALRRVRGDVRRTLHSDATVEGWAHYAEELMVEEGFRADDPRFAVGVAVKALLRVTRLAVAIGVHTGTTTVAEAERRFADDAFLRGPAARAEAARATFDPTYGRYTWGKLALRDLRERARREWGAAFTLRRFHRAVLDLGAPPLPLLGAALDGG